MYYENNRLIEHTQEEIDTMLVEIIFILFIRDE